MLVWEKISSVSQILPSALSHPLRPSKEKATLWVKAAFFLVTTTKDAAPILASVAPMVDARGMASREICAEIVVEVRDVPEALPVAERVMVRLPLLSWYTRKVCFMARVLLL